MNNYVCESFHLSEYNIIASASCQLFRYQQTTEQILTKVIHANNMRKYVLYLHIYQNLQAQFLNFIQSLFILLLCFVISETPQHPINVPYECEMNFDPSCQDQLSVWLLGTYGECMNPNAGFRFGKTGYKLGGIQV